MKSIQSFDQHGRFSVWLGILTSFLITSSALQAAPGGSGPGSAVAGSGGAAAGGGAVSGGGSHSAGVGARGGGANNGGMRSSLGGAPSAFGRTPSAFGNAPSAFGRTPSVFSHASQTGAGPRFSAPTVGRYAGVQSNGTSGAYRANPVQTQRVVPPNNPWTERTAGVQQGVSRGTPASRQGNRNTQATAKQGYSTGGYNGRNGNYGYNGGLTHGNRFNQYRARNYYPYYGYGFGYFPFIGDYGYYGGLTGLDSGYAGLDSNYTGLNNGYINGGPLTPAPGLGADSQNFNSGYVQPQIQDQGTNAPNNGASDPAQAGSPDQAQAPTPAVNQQQNPRSPSSRGPDSLVEAVQSELSNRGYYKGKVDAMFNDDTKEAIRKFQSDNQLTATGLLNNATLTMLGLN